MNRLSFENIRNINVEDYLSLKDKIFLTFDLDWCSDEVLLYTLEIIEKNDIKATFFVTHYTPLIERMRKNPNIELGIHPNFNFLLNGDFRHGKNVEEVIRYYKDIIPEALSVRSHSMTQSSFILDKFEKYGLLYDCNTFIPYSSGIKNKPYKHWTKNLIKVPYFWEDDIHMIYRWDWDVKLFISYEGIKVFDFHPIHIFLNCESMNRYNEAKKNNFLNLEKYKYKGYGIYNFFIDLIALIRGH